MGRLGRGVLLALFVLLLAGGGAAGGWFGSGALDRPRPLPTSPAPAVLGSAVATPPVAPTPTPAADAQAGAVARRLAAPLSAAGLGSRVFASVIDPGDGAPLLARDVSTPAAPASTAKLLTAAAALLVYPPTQRFPTVVVQGQPGTVVLVGGGDPTLTAAPAGESGAYRDAARITDLAAALRAAHVPVQRIVVDGTLFSGPSTSPEWDPGDVPTDYASPITAIMVDGGRDAPGDTIRSAAPDLAAGRALAAALGSPNLPVARGSAPAGGLQLARVQSAPLSELIEQMLQPSDNVIAECLARLVALAHGDPATFTGAAAAVKAVLATRGVTENGVMYDGSGLAAADRLDAATLTSVLRLAVTTPRLRPLLAALPVAGWSGTLADRYLGGSAAAAAGDVRAKTGTLTGVSALAGVVHTRDGQLLVFALLADRVSPSYAGTTAAEAALDAVAAAIASCGCG